MRVFGRTPDSIPEKEKRRWFGYVEQQFRMVPGAVGDQVSLFDPEVTEVQIRDALEMVGLGEIEYVGVCDILGGVMIVLGG